jgi:hypothetical protein
VMIRSRLRGRLRLLLLMIGVVSAGASALAVAQSASGLEANYSCEHCAAETGPNQNPINYDEAINYSGDGVCAAFWEYKGEKSYRLVERKCTPSPTSEYISENAFPCSNYDAHGEVERYYTSYTYTLAGHQDWVCE